MKIVRSATLVRRMRYKWRNRHACAPTPRTHFRLSTNSPPLLAPTFLSLINSCLLCQLDISHHQHSIKLNLDKDDKGGESKPASGGAADGDGGK